MQHSWGFHVGGKGIVPVAGRMQGVFLPRDETLRYRFPHVPRGEDSEVNVGIWDVTRWLNSMNCCKF